MSQLDTTFDDIDADLDALLNQDEAMEDAPASQPPAKAVEAPAATEAAPTDTNMPDAAEEAEVAAAPKSHQVTADDIQEPAKPASGGTAKPASGGLAKPAIGSKKRQLTVPSVTMPPAGKRPTLKVQQANTAPAKPATVSVRTPPTAAPSEPITATTEAAAAPEESESSSPAKPPKPSSPAAAAAKPTEDAAAAAAEDEEAAAAAEVMSSLGELTEQLAGAASDAEEAGAEGEATSPKKPAAPAAPAAPASKKALTVAAAPAAGAAPAASSAPAASKSSKPSKPEKEKKEKAAPKKAAAAAAAGEAEGPVGKLPTAKSAYMLFADDKRTQVKADHPDLSFGEVGRKLGELWKALSEEEKKAYNDRAAADKVRVAAEIAAMDQGLVAQLKAAKGSKKGKKDGKAAADEEAAAAPAEKSETKKEKKEKKSDKSTEKDAAKAEKKAEKAAAKKAEKEKAAWESGGKKMHHRQLFVPTRVEHPGADIAQINTIISQAWEALTAEEREQFCKQAAEEAEADKALKAKRAPKAAASEAGSSKAASKPGKRGRKAAASGDEESSGEEAAADDGEDSDREDVDWSEHPAAGVFAHSTGSDGRQLLMVRRAGCGLDDYGTVDARQVKHARIEGGAADLPVSPEMVEEYDQFVHRFWAAVRSRTSRNELDLEGLEEGSPLEMCYLLGKLQEPGQILDANDKESKGKDKKDFIIRCPGLKLSMVVQRLLDQERAQLQQLARKVQGCSSLEEAQEAVDGLVVE